MRGRLTTGDKWWVAATVLLAWGAVADLAWTPKHRVATELPPVTLGFAVGVVAALVGLAIAARLKLPGRLTRFLESDRWMGRPRLVDFLMLFACVAIGSQLSQWVIAQHIAHGGDLLYGLVDGIAIVLVVAHLARHRAMPPDTV